MLMLAPKTAVPILLPLALLHDNFDRPRIADGWMWLREHRENWRLVGNGLEVKLEPGNMWGPANDAKNVLVRPAPVTTNSELEVTATVENRPTHQYEQVDLVWFYDDSNMVKLGEELVDGQLSIVMGREEEDKTRTIAIVPLAKTKVQLRMLVSTNTIHGQFREMNSNEWRDAGTCTMPAPPHKSPRLSLQFYQGEKDIEHWARVTEFAVVKRSIQ
jgi:regulation of enolase protein 1 (concanavalin A-like superfamily)